MKKLLCLILMCMVLTSCETYANNNGDTKYPPDTLETITPTSTPEEETNINVFEQYPTVDINDIKSGMYTNQYVILTAVVDNIDYNYSSLIGFDAWYAIGDTYIKKSESISWDELDTEQIDIAEGDVLKVCTKVYDDNSFGFTAAIAVEKTESNETLKDIYKAYKKSCKGMKYKDVLRYPDNYYSNNFKISGKVFQIVSEDNGDVEFTIKDKDKNILYMEYTLHDDEPRILEGDSIIAYGTFYKLYTYQSVLGSEKTVPKLHCETIEIK